MSPHQVSCTLMTNVFNLCVVSRIFTLDQLKSNHTTTQILHAFLVFNSKMTKSSEYGEEFNKQQKVIKQQEKLIEHSIENNILIIQTQLEIIATCFIIITTYFVLIATYFITSYCIVLGISINTKDLENNPLISVSKQLQHYLMQ